MGKGCAGGWGRQARREEASDERRGRGLRGGIGRDRADEGGGEAKLSLTGAQFDELDWIPPKERENGGHGFPDAGNAQVPDLASLRGLLGLQVFSLGEIQVQDCDPLRGLTELESLSLAQTLVEDLTPLLNLPNLRRLFLDGSQVLDLRPKPGPHRTEARGGFVERLSFADTPAARATPDLARLAQIDNATECAARTGVDLKTLPPYPELLPWYGAVSDPAQDMPANSPAPLQVTEVDGVLRPASLGDGLDERGQNLARQGWAALRDYLADLAGQKPRTGNTMPRAGLGSRPSRSRVRTGRRTDDRRRGRHPGQPGDPSVRRGRRGAVGAGCRGRGRDCRGGGTFLERFPDWRACRNDAGRTTPDPAKVLDIISRIEDLSEALVGQG